MRNLPRRSHAYAFEYSDAAPNRHSHPLRNFDTELHSEQHPELHAHGDAITHADGHCHHHGNTFEYAFTQPVADTEPHRLRHSHTILHALSNAKPEPLANRNTHWLADPYLLPLAFFHANSDANLQPKPIPERNAVSKPDADSDPTAAHRYADGVTYLLTYGEPNAEPERHAVSH